MKEWVYSRFQNPLLSIDDSALLTSKYWQCLFYAGRLGRMVDNLVAKAEISIDASTRAVWEALTDPDKIKQYMFGTDVVSDWNEGSSIVWKGRWQGKDYVDKGTILQIKEEQLLQYSHFSPLSGKPDEPEHYHIVTVELSGNKEQTKVTLTQDSNETEEIREHSEKNWNMMLQELKKLLEH